MFLSYTILTLLARVIPLSLKKFPFTHFLPFVYLFMVIYLELKHRHTVSNCALVAGHIWMGREMLFHYGDVIMRAMASHLTSLTIVCSNVCSGPDQRKHQSSASQAFVWGNSSVTGEFPTQRASNAQNAPIWWRHLVDRTSAESGPLWRFHWEFIFDFILLLLFYFTTLLQLCGLFLFYFSPTSWPRAFRAPRTLSCITWLYSFYSAVPSLASKNMWSVLSVVFGFLWVCWVWLKKFAGKGQPAFFKIAESFDHTSMHRVLEIFIWLEGPFHQLLLRI